MKSIKVCEYSRSRSFHDNLILQDQASGERSQDQWSSVFLFFFFFVFFFFEKHFQDFTLISKFTVGLNAFIPDGLSEPEFYGDLETYREE